MRRIPLLLAVFLLYSCSGGPTSPAPPEKVPVSIAGPAKMVGLDGDKSPALGDGTPTMDAILFSYEPGARRDPFRSLVIRERKMKGGTPLQQRGVAEIKLVGIVWESEGYSAMVETPDGKGFTLRVGTPVGPSGGKVKRITEKSVIIQEITRDFAGLKKSKETVIGLRTKEEELE